MPGFSINGSGGSAQSKAEIRRTHRWEMTITGLSATGPSGGLATSIGPIAASVSLGGGSQSVTVYLEKANRPSVKSDVQKMHHNQEEARFAGKHSWNTIDCEWYDVEQPVDVSSALWNWYNGVIQIGTANVYSPLQYKKDSQLTMKDGLGVSNEQWGIYNSWPSEMDWKGLTYTSSELQKISAKIEYDRAQRFTASGVSFDVAASIPGLSGGFGI